MKRSDKEYKNYVSILNEELLPAMGCTEPVAVAYAAAKAREVLGCIPECCHLYVSGNIIKNVKSVVVPNTGGLKGLKAAAAAGIVTGKAELQMSVIAETKPEDIPNIQKYIDQHEISIERKEGDSALYIEVFLEGGGHSSRAVISDYHTNIVLLEKDGEIIFQKEPELRSSFVSDHSLMSLEGMWDFINTVEIEDISGLLDSQISCNSEISKEGLEKPWGAQIGQGYGQGRRRLRRQDERLRKARGHRWRQRKPGPYRHHARAGVCRASGQQPGTGIPGSGPGKPHGRIS